MSNTVERAATSRVQFGMARAEITPPIGIYHPMWGAARHHRATGVHRPLYADVMAIAAADGDILFIQAQLDMVGLEQDVYDNFAAAMAQGAEVGVDQVVFSFSHTHAGGLFGASRLELPGGELIPAYLVDVCARLKEAAQSAASSLEEAAITYATGRCNMAANRDYWDDENDLYACGFNPGAPADDTVLVARVNRVDGEEIAVLVNYACHPTTLAWENTLISPDYVGGLREVVESATGCPCVFTLGACGDLGPRRSHQGDTAVADANGRQLGYAVLATLESMSLPATDFAYQGPVISGATLGTWTDVPFDDARQNEAARISGGRFVVNLPLKPRPDVAELETEMAMWLERQQQADAAGNVVEARDCGARAERARRWLARLAGLPKGDSYSFSYSVHRVGDTFWVGVSGEPYNWLQTELRSRFSATPIVVTVLASPLNIAYLLPRERYGQGLYQEEPSILALGCLELLVEAISGRIQEMS